MSGFGVGALVLIAVLYFLPTFVAFMRRQRLGLVLVINFLLGWTVVGWIVALILSVWPAPKATYVEVPYDGATYETRTPAGHGR
jgi:uncharacterized membrane protein